MLLRVGPKKLRSSFTVPGKRRSASSALLANDESTAAITSAGL